MTNTISLVTIAGCILILATIYVFFMRPRLRDALLSNAQRGKNIVAEAQPVFVPTQTRLTVTPEVLYALDTRIKNSQAAQDAETLIFAYAGDPKSQPSDIIDRMVALFERLGGPITAATEQGINVVFDSAGDQFLPILEHASTSFVEAFNADPERLGLMVAETARLVQKLHHFNPLDFDGWSAQMHDELMRWAHIWNLPPEDIAQLAGEHAGNTVTMMSVVDGSSLPFLSMLTSGYRQTRLLQAGHTTGATAASHIVIDVGTSWVGAKVGVLGAGAVVAIAGAAGLALTPPGWVFMAAAVAGAIVGRRQGDKLKARAYERALNEYKGMQQTFAAEWQAAYQEFDKRLTSETTTVRNALGTRIQILPPLVQDTRLIKIVLVLADAYVKDISEARREAQAAKTQAQSEVADTWLQRLGGIGISADQVRFIESQTEASLALLDSVTMQIPNEAQIQADPIGSLDWLAKADSLRNGSFSRALLDADMALQSFLQARTNELLAWEQELLSSRARAAYTINALAAAEQLRIADLEQQWKQKMNNQVDVMNRERLKLGLKPLGILGIANSSGS